MESKKVYIVMHPYVFGARKNLESWHESFFTFHKEDLEKFGIACERIDDLKDLRKPHIIEGGVLLFLSADVGLGFAQDLKREYPSARIILLSGYGWAKGEKDHQGVWVVERRIPDVFEAIRRFVNRDSN